MLIVFYSTSPSKPSEFRSRTSKARIVSQARWGVHRCGCTGTIPRDIGALTSLKWLDVSDNRLGGERFTSRVTYVLL